MSERPVAQDEEARRLTQGQGGAAAGGGDGVDGFPDDLLSKRFPVYTRGNIGEVMPDALTPMQISTMDMLNNAQVKALARMGVITPDEVEPDRRVTFPVINGFTFVNLSLFRIIGVRVEGLTPELIDEAFATGPDLPPYRPHPDDESPEAGARMAETLQWALSVDDLPEVAEARSRVDELRRGRPDLTTLTVPELVARYRELVALAEEHWSRHLFISFCRSFPYGLYALFVPPEEGRVTPLALIEIGAGVEDLESAAPAMGLWEMSRAVLACPALTEMFDAGLAALPERLAATEDPGALAFRDTLEEFCGEYGYRGVAEINLIAPTWETHPESVLALIDRLRLAPDDQAPARTRMDARVRAETAVDQIVTAFDEDTTALLRRAAVAARTLDAGRERCKANAVKTTHEQRLTFRELGRRFVDAGQMELIEDVFMLRDDEMEAFIDDPGPFAERIRVRRDHYRSLGDVEPPFAFEGSPPPLATWSRRTAHASARPGTVLRGIPGSLGIATGRARVVRNLEECDELEPGEILVAPLTDAAWTPLFIPAAGVVTEIGGTASHAMIVAREMGLPCVASVVGACSLIPAGAVITIDGAAGTVTLA